MDLVRNYIQYLRDVSRKIVSRAGFENVLPSETRRKSNYYFNLDNYSELNKLFCDDEYYVPKTNKDFYEYIKNVNHFLRTYDGYKLFIGFGLIHGKYEKSQFFAPLVIAVCNISDIDNNHFHINIDEQSYQINYDLLARFLDIRIEEEFDNERILTPEEEEKFRAIEEVENSLINSVQNNNIPDINDIFAKLKEKIPNFNQIYLNDLSFKYDLRFINQFINDKLFYTMHIFCFVRNVPNILSTYEALNDLLQQDQISNELLNKLLINSIKNENVKFPKSDKISESNILKSINNIPFTLSKNQIDAIKLTWQNPITYIEGPPGTGKSYTIQALLLTALILNKKILFVSLKKPALKVVKNEIEKILGKEAILYIATTSREYGARDKKATIDYLKSLLYESRMLNQDKLNDKEKEIENLINKINDYNKNIRQILKLINIDLQLAKEYYKLNSQFIDKRNFISNVLGINLNNYYFANNNFDKAKFDKLFEKLRFVYSKKSTNRLNEIFRRKALKYFHSEFKANLQILQNDVDFFKDIFELNYYHSQSEKLKNKIDDRRLDNNRKRLLKQQNEKKELLNKIFQKIFRFNILKKIYNNNEAINTIQNYSSALFRVSPKAIIQYWNKVDFELLTDIIPLWCAELRDLGIVFPMKNEIFDLIVVDEASQVNIAEIIPAFYRGKKFCIVGDDKQLHLNATGVGFSLSKSFDNLCWNKNNLNDYINVAEAKTRNLLVSDASILRFINSDLRTHRIPQIQLDEHYRSLPHLAKFNSNFFYGNNWKIMTENGKNRLLNCFKAIKVNGSRDNSQKFVQAEIDELINQLKKIIINDGYINHEDLRHFDFNGRKPTIGILSILRNQITKINEALEDNGFSEREFNSFEIMVGTPEDFQGNEKDIMFITIGLDQNSGWGKAHYENPNRFNVATSRAKYFTYFIYAGIPRNAALIKKYLNHFGVMINQVDLIDTENTSETEILIDNWKYDRKKCESEFEHKVADYLEIFVNENSNIELFNQVTACGQKRLDFVLYNRDKQITCAIEVDGKDHFIGETENYTEAHLERIEILKRAKWDIIHIKYHKWYSNGWICDTNNPFFADEINSIYNQLKEKLQINRH
jgi:hypothetical protein